MAIEISLVLPCLNEQDTIRICVEKANKAFAGGGLSGEVVVVDNGSTDKSVEIAKNAGAVVVYESAKGYGSALRRGIDEANGKYIIMGDSDDTYDFLEIPKFVKLLREGYDLVMGSRFRGKILPGAMTWSHRYVGNPILSGMLRLFFGGKVSDAHCGLRGFSKEAYKKMGLHTTGMEFASEMVIHALKKKLKITEVPITYHVRRGESKLSSFRDAWRHIRFMLLYSPNYLFLLPAGVIFLAGFLINIRLLFGPIHFMGRGWDLHVAIFSGMLTILGWQILNLGFAAKAYSHIIGLEESNITRRFLEIFNLERTIIFGVLIFLCGLGMSLYILYVWAMASFGELAQIKTGIIALSFIAMGIQTIFTGFLTSYLQIKYR